jgi:hypothetical protein
LLVLVLVLVLEVEVGEEEELLLLEVEGEVPVVVVVVLLLLRRHYPPWTQLVKYVSKDHNTRIMSNLRTAVNCSSYSYDESGIMLIVAVQKRKGWFELTSAARSTRRSSL